MQNGDKKYSVIIQDPATEMLLQHVNFLTQVSETAAERLAKGFMTKAKTLETMPERCPWLNATIAAPHKYRKLLFEKHYMLLFQVAEDKVFVDAIVDCRQDYAWLLC